MRKSFIIVVLCSAVFLFGCGSRELSRDGAEELIESSDEVKMQASGVTGQMNFIEEGVVQGLWTIDGSDLMLTDAASKEISEINGSKIIPVNPVSIEVKVTGITEPGGEGSIKTAEFEWNYKDLTPLVRRFSVQGGSGTAVLQRYDDGWRVARLTLKVSDLPIELSNKEVAAIESDIDSANKRAIDEVNEMYALWEPGKSNRTIYLNPPGTSQWYRTDFTDNAMVSYIADSKSGPWKLANSYWYGIIDQPTPHTYAPVSQPGPVRIIFWRPNGALQTSSETYGSMGLPVEEFIGILSYHRDRWRERHADKLDPKTKGIYVKKKYRDAYVNLYNANGSKKEN